MKTGGVLWQGDEDRWCVVAGGPGGTGGAEEPDVARQGHAGPDDLHEHLHAQQGPHQPCLRDVRMVGRGAHPQHPLHVLNQAPPLLRQTRVHRHICGGGYILHPHSLSKALLSSSRLVAVNDIPTETRSGLIQL